MKTPITVTEDVLEGLNAVRESGLTNMLHRRKVADIAGELGYEATADWIREHGDLYAQGVFHGFTLDEEG